MQVKDLVLYQIATDRDYKIGDKFSVGDGLNFSIKRDLDSDFKLGDERLVTLARDYKEKGISPDDLIAEMTKKLDRAESLTCQLAMEFVREKYFPSLPSRFKCMYFSSTAEECMEGYSGAVKRRTDRHYQVVSARLNGRAFYSRSVPIVRPGWSFLEYCDFAMKYWGQDEHSTDPILEIFFEGDVEIVDILADSRADKV